MPGGKYHKTKGFFEFGADEKILRVLGASYLVTCCLFDIVYFTRDKTQRVNSALLTSLFHIMSVGNGGRWGAQGGKIWDIRRAVYRSAVQ